MKDLCLMLYVLLLIALCNLQTGDGRTTLNILDFKPKKSSNGPTVDHSKAFKDAWEVLCGAKANNASTLLVPKNATFIVHPINFSGPCKSSHLHLQIDGKIEAPRSPKEWPEHERECLLCFENVSGLFINGSGLIHAHGEAWWDSVPHSKRPRTVRFNGVANVVYNGLTQMNSPKNHISVHNCTNATLSRLHLIAPGESPNTDGIDISLSNNVHILNSSIETGDDCVAINAGSRNINITRVACGPGHGISIGSLGKGGANETVENVNVKNCTFNGTQNGVRIKTWTGGVGFARNILFENITLIDAENPIIIDQHYCNGQHDCDHQKETAVEVSNVTYRYFAGTCADETAIKLDCDKEMGCRSIVLDHINITSSSPKDDLSAFCQFAHVIAKFVSVDLNCSTKYLGPHLSL